MADALYVKKSKTNAAFLPELARFLINDLAGETGPATPWTIVEAYSSAAVDTHEIPSITSDMDSLAADNGWRTGTLAVSDWIVLESGSAANKFRVGFEYQSNDQIKFILDFKAGFTTGQENADMTTAGNWSTTTSAVSTFDTNNVGGSGNWSIAADRDQFKIFYEDGTVANMNFIYVGKVDDPLTEDEYNSVIYMTPTVVGHTYSANMGSATAFDKLSMADDTTLAAASAASFYYAGGDITTDTANLAKDSTTSKQRIFPLLIVVDDSGAANQVVGFLKNCWFTTSAVVGTGTATLGTMTYLAFGDNAASGKIVISWDGATAY